MKTYEKHYKMLLNSIKVDKNKWRTVSIHILAKKY